MDKQDKPLRMKISLGREAISPQLYDELMAIPTDKGRANRIRSLVQVGFMAERLMSADRLAAQSILRSGPASPGLAETPAATVVTPRSGGSDNAAGSDNALRPDELSDLFGGNALMPG